MSLEEPQKEVSCDPVNEMVNLFSSKIKDGLDIDDPIFKDPKFTDLVCTLTLNQKAQILSEFMRNYHPETAKHCDRMVDLSIQMLERISEKKNLTSEEMKIVALIHNIGKIFIPLEIIDKEGELDDKEYEIMKQHSEKGKKFAEYYNFKPEIIKVFTSHHERFNGKGYPLGLIGKQIPLEGRILSIIDVYDSLISKRSYKKPWTREKAIKLITNNVAQDFDPDLVNIFEELLKGGH